jgi:hypothetical protein
MPDVVHLVWGKCSIATVLPARSVPGQTPQGELPRLGAPLKGGHVDMKIGADLEFHVRIRILIGGEVDQLIGHRSCTDRLWESGRRHVLAGGRAVCGKKDMAADASNWLELRR